MVKLAEILKDLEQGKISSEHAETKILDLFGISDKECECDTPYFPTGNIHFCSKCNNPTSY